jgi:hypothetical protein
MEFYGLDLPGSGLRPLSGSCEHGNEPSGSRKCWEMSLLIEQLVAFQEGPNSIELVLVGLHCKDPSTLLCSCSPGLCSSGDSSGFYLCS